MEEQAKFEGGAVVEIISHQKHAGYCQTQTIGSLPCWLLVGATVPPDGDVPEVVNQGCALCDKALDSLSMDQVLRLAGVHCAHCGQLRRSNR